MAFALFRRPGLLLAGGLLVHSAHAQTWQQVATQAATSAPGTMTVLASTADAAGSIVVAGTFTGLLQLGALPALNSAGRGDLFVARLSPTGTWQQAVSAGGTDTDQVRALALAPNGDVVLAGQFASPTLVLGGTTLTNAGPVGTADLFAARLTPAGTWAAAAAAGGTGDEYVGGVGVDAAGVATVVGAFRSATLAVGGTTLTNAGPAATSPSGTSADLFVARLNSTGTWSQAVRAGGALDELAEAVAVTATGVAVVGGSFSSPSVAFDALTLANSVPTEQEPDAFVARLDPAGAWVQAVSAGAANGDIISTMAVDATSNVVVGGYFFGPTTTLGLLRLTNADATGNTSDIFVGRLSAAGAWTQAVRGGSDGMDYLSALRLDSQGSATVAGTFAGTSLRLGTFTLPNAGSTDLFAAQLNTAGVWTHAAAAGGAGNDYATTVSITGAGRAYVGGLLASGVATFGTIPVNRGEPTGYVAILGGLPLATRPAAAAVAGLTLAPNPLKTGTHLTLRYELPARATVSVHLLDGLGRTVRAVAPVSQTAGTHEQQIPTTGLAAGLYTVRVECDGQTSYGRVAVE